MARSTNNLLFKGVSGKLDQLVIKQYANGIVISKKPDMSRVKRTALQKSEQIKFKQAVAYAQGIIRDPKQKVAYARKLKKGQSVYHAAIKEFLSR